MTAAVTKRSCETQLSSLPSDAFSLRLSPDGLVYDKAVALTLSKHIKLEHNNGQTNISILSSCSPIFIYCESNVTYNLEIAKNVHISIIEILEKSKSQAEIRANIQVHEQASLLLTSINQEDSELNYSRHFYINKNAIIKLIDLDLQEIIGYKNTTVDLLENAAQFYYHGLNILNKNSCFQSNLIINHKAEHSISTQNFRGLFGNRAKALFLGKVIVHKNAANSEARQLYRAILVSAEAKAEVRPELEIYNHDIAASHGATIGELDKNALFYLQSRAIPLLQAKKMLLLGTSNEIVAALPNDAVKPFLRELCANAIEKLLRGNNEL
jgi:Fe-S cluster assembly scaffold protein SufB